MTFIIHQNRLDAWLGEDTEVIIPEGVEEIAAGVFKNAMYLRSVRLPSTLHRIGAEAFSGCVSLERIRIPEGVTVLESKTFRLCSAMWECILPDSLKRIGEQVFYGCRSLTQIQIPEHLLIASDAFQLCQADYVMQNGSYSLRLPYTYVPSYRTALHLFLSAVGTETEQYAFGNIPVFVYQIYIAVYYAIAHQREYAIRFLKENQREICRSLLHDHDNADQLELVLSFGFLTTEYLDSLVEDSIEENAMHCRLLLMDYKAEHFGVTDDLDFL